MLGGLKATKCMYVAPVSTGDGCISTLCWYLTQIDEDTMIQFFQIWTLKDKVAYIFTFSCESSLFEKFQKTIATMLQSFKLIKIKKQIKASHVLANLRARSNSWIAACCTARARSRVARAQICTASAALVGRVSSGLDCRRQGPTDWLQLRVSAVQTRMTRHLTRVTGRARAVKCRTSVWPCTPRRCLPQRATPSRTSVALRAFKSRRCCPWLKSPWRSSRSVACLLALRPSRRILWQSAIDSCKCSRSATTSFTRWLWLPTRPRTMTSVPSRSLSALLRPSSSYKLVRAPPIVVEFSFQWF